MEREILPSSSFASPQGHGVGYSARLPKQKRVLVQSACLACRKAKLKCDGARPSCGRCTSRDAECIYDVEPNTTRTMALKRRAESSRVELETYQELYTMLRTRSEREALEILRRIRRNEQPSTVLQLIGEADLLMHANLPNSSTINDRFAVIIEKINQEALQRSSIKVRARPWTIVAGDGVVSELISNFFGREHPFLIPTINKECFLAEMASGEEPHRLRFCSPLLVNAICAYSAFLTKSVKKLDILLDSRIEERFFEEARRLFDLRCGEASLRTAQGLSIMYVYLSMRGRDRAGNLYRFAACGIFRRLQLADRKLPQSGVPSTKEKGDDERGISQSIWGFFCLESLNASLYMQKSLVSIPTMRRNFAEMVISPEEELRHEITAPEVINELCNLATIMYEYWTYTEKLDKQTSKAKDIQHRIGVYQKIVGDIERLPNKSRYSVASRRQYHYLRGFYHASCVRVLRSLDNAHGLDVLVGTVADKHPCIYHCHEMIGEVYAAHQYDTQWNPTSLYICYMCCFTLVLYWTDSRTPELFVLTCELLYQSSVHFPVSLSLLRGINALAHEMNVELPADCAKYFEKAMLDTEHARDIPVSYVLPPYSQILEALNSDDLNMTEKIGLRLSDLIGRWSALAIDD